MHTHNGDPLSLFANLMPVHVHNLQTYDNLVSMHIIIYKEIKLFLFSSIFYLYTILIVQNVIFCTYKSKFVPLNDISQIEERLISQILFWTQDVKGSRSGYMVFQYLASLVLCKGH